MKIRFKLLVLFILIIGFGLLFSLYDKKKHVEAEYVTEKKLVDEKKIFFNKFVKTINDSYLYDDNDNVVGMIGKDVELTLVDGNSLVKGKYFGIYGLDGNYYIEYSNLINIKQLSSFDDRYKNYIVFNENIVTNDKTSFYDENDNLVYQFDKSYNLPIIIKDNDRYGVEYNNRLLYVRKDNVVNVKYNYNTNKSSSSGIGVLNYHAFYDENNLEEKAKCTSIICHSKSQFKEHLDYFKDNNIFTLKMKELEMYIDGKLQLPKSVLITIDDGDRTKLAVDLLTEYKMYATIFLITAWYDPSDYYVTKYIELHSHSDNMHKNGVCPVGQGGGIQCLGEDKIQNDLRLSRRKLNNTTYFCYPFYEYNDYSIEMLKEAGFTMAFAGENNLGDNLVHVGSDKFRLNRFVVVNYTELSDFDTFFEGYNR